MTTLLLVHGMWHGAWCWDDVCARLSRPSVAVELPMRSLAHDAEVVRAALDSIDDEVVLVGHSYGGAVITAAGAHRRVRRLVYLAAFLLDEGESVSRVAPELGIADTGLGAALRFSEDRSEVRIDPELAPTLLYQRTSPAAVAQASARLRPVARAVFGERPNALAWRRVPSTYVICTEDRTVAPALQRVMAARATDVVEWPSDHSPQASRPDDVAALLDSV
ncbi:alpha/beta fold hydrolase [uncultured Jatrophihabitans sp.]|uniref:alpha/beta fold hydrolase n=1 Tax=uncultured Jatrophihabitans sp. TaxID=1610747 RepID=UPI0035CC2ADE